MTLNVTWEVKKLGKLCDIELGRTPYRSDKSYWDPEKNTSNVWLSIADLLKTHEKIVVDSKEYVSNKGVEISKLVKKGTLLVSFKLTLGRLAFAGRDLFTNEAIAALNINDKEEISKNYLYYFLTFFDWDKATEGDIKVKGKTFNKKKLNNIDVILPPLPEQQRIVTILDAAFAEIGRMKKNTEKNLVNAEEVFESYLQEIFENRGEGGVWKSIDEVCIKTNNYDWEKNADSEKKYVDLSSVSRESLSVVNNQIITSENAPSRARKIIKKNDVIFGTTRPTLKRVAKIGEELDGHICSTGFTVLRPNRSMVSSDIIYYFLQTSIFISKMAQIQRGASYPAVTDKEVKNQCFWLPPLNIQQKIIHKTNHLISQSRILSGLYEIKLSTLNELQQSILRKAFEGKLIGGTV